jgi:hypothetical protein
LLQRLLQGQFHLHPKQRLCPRQDAWFAHLGVQADAPDHPGGLSHLRDGKAVASVSAFALAAGTEHFHTHGFYGENEAFFDAVRHGERPVDDLRSCVQSVAVSEAMRQRRAEYHAEPGE